MGLDDRNVKKPQPFAFRTRMILKKAKQKRALFRLRTGVAPIQIPEQRFAGGPGFSVFFHTPDRPERGIVAFNVFAVRRQRFEWSQGLETAVSVVVLFNRI